MAILGLFKSSEIEQFAKNLAQDIAKRYPPALDATPEKKISGNRITKVLEDALSKAVEFKEQNKLGLVKKARLGNAFKWELKELGYSEQFIDIATEGLIVYITRKTPKSTTSADS
jgi:hypothetical protein